MALVILALAQVGQAQDYEQERAELEALEEDLRAVQEELRADRAARDRVEAELARLGQRVSEARRDLARVEERQQSARQRVAELKAEQEAEAQRLATHRESLAEQLVAAYVSGDDSQLKLLLNQRNPGAAQRLLVYHHYLEAARAQRMQASMAELEGLAELRSELDEEIKRLERLEQEAEAKRQALEARRERRDSRRQELEARIAERREQEARLQEVVAEQEALLEDLRERVAEVPGGTVSSEELESARGQLPWPIEGSVVAEFGEMRRGGVERTGIVVEADRGSEVRAVAAGRVVFSDWLRGLGLLAIIDHGNEYLTLYGHAEALYVAVGDWVEAGEPVATAGSSGPRHEAGLYFEIRRGAEPQNPMAGA